MKNQQSTVTSVDAQSPIDLDAKHQKDMVAWLHSKMETLPSYSTTLSMLLLEEIRTGKPDALSISYELEELRQETERTDPEYHTIVKDEFLETIIALEDEAGQMWNEHTERQDAQYEAEQATEKARRREARREKRERKGREKREARRADKERREQRRLESKAVARADALATMAERLLANMDDEQQEWLWADTESETEENNTGSNKGMCGLQEAPPTDVDHRQTNFRTRTSSHTSPFRQPSQFRQHPQQWQPSVYNQYPEYDQHSHSSYVHYDHYHQSYSELSVYGRPSHSPYPHNHRQKPQYQNPYSNNEYQRQYQHQHQYPRPSHDISPQPQAPPSPMNPTLPTQPRPEQAPNPTHSNIANPKAAPSILDSRGEVDNMGNAQLVVDTSADTAQAEEEETVDLDVVLPYAEDNAEDSAVVDDTTVVKDMTVVEGMAETDIGSGDTPTHIKTAQTTTIAAPSVAVSLLNVETRGGMNHPVDTVLLTKDGGCNAIDYTDCTGTTPDDCQVDTTNLTKNVAESFPNDKTRGEMILLDTVLLTKDGGSKDDDACTISCSDDDKIHDYPADCYDELFNLIAKDMRRVIYLHADSHARLQMSQLDGDSIDNYIDDTTLAYFTDTGALEAGESINTCLGTTDYFSDFEENSRNESFRTCSINYFPGEFESLKYWHEFDFKHEFEDPQCEFGFYMKFFFDNIDPELSLTAPDAFHAYEFDFDPQILTTGPEAFRAYDHSLDETIDYTAHVRAGVT